MARHDVMVMAPESELTEVDEFLQALLDDVGTPQIALNAYVDGQNPQAATYGMTVTNCTDQQVSLLTAFLAQMSVSDCKVYATAGSGSNFWADALAEWNLKQVVPA